MNSGEKVELGMVMRGLDDLCKTVDNGFGRGERRFDAIDKKIDDNYKNLPCKENTKKIQTMSIFIEKENKKEAKREKRNDLLFSVLIKKVLPSLTGLGLTAATVYAAAQTYIDSLP